MRLLMVTLLGYWAAITAPNTINYHSLTIVVENLKNSDGSLIFTLYNKDGTIPDEKFQAYYKKAEVEIKSKRARFTFNQIPGGTYAIAILHDENNNGKIDKKFMLPLPKEGVGFSNYTDFGLSNRPNFKGASFTLDSDKTMVVKVIYK